MAYTTDFTILDEDDPKKTPPPGGGVSPRLLALIAQNSGGDPQKADELLRIIAGPQGSYGSSNPLQPSPIIPPGQVQQPKQQAPVIPMTPRTGAPQSAFTQPPQEQQFRMSMRDDKAPQVSTPKQAIAPQQNNDLADYLKMFQQFLTPPVEDKAKQNRLKTAAALNALGNALVNVMNMTQFGQAPVAVKTDNSAMAYPLAQAEQLRQEYVQQKNLYDQMNLRLMGDAVQMQRQDKRWDKADQMQRERWDKEDAIRKEGWDRQAQEAQKDRDFRAQQMETEYAKRAELYDKQFKNELSILDKRHQYEVDEIGKRYGAAAAAAAANIGEKAFPVIDHATGKTVILPPELYWDVMSKELQKQNKDIAEWVTSADYNATDNSANAIVAESWSKHYDPVYDAAGNVTGFKPKSGASTGGSWLQDNTKPAAGKGDAPAFFQEEEQD